MYLLFNFSKISSRNNYIRNILNSKSNCLHYLLHKKCSFSLKYLCHKTLQNAPNCTIEKKKNFRLNICCLSNVFQDQETSNSLKMIPRCLNMDLRPCPKVAYALDIYVQAMRFTLPFCCQ